MALLGGSPLGLIGVRSTPRSTGMSYFNGGDSRNINVSNYNKGTDTYPIINLGDNKLGSVKKIIKFIQTYGYTNILWINL